MRQVLLYLYHYESNIESILSEEGYRIITATNGAAALEIARTEPVDLVLLDVMMPGTDGYDTCRSLKSDSTTQHIPIIFLTALGAVEDEAIGLDMGAVDYLVKPVNSRILKARVRNHITLKKCRDSLEEFCMIDALTGIPSRRYFEMILEKEWRRSLRTQSAISLLLIDIDKFNDYNLRCGFGAGDICLKKVSSVLERSAKRSGDTLVRFAGEEFALISTSLNAQNAKNLAERICRDVLANSPVTVSVGVCTTVPSSGESFAKLVVEASRALRLAKEDGDGKVAFCSDSHSGAEWETNSSGGKN